MESTSSNPIEAAHSSQTAVEYQVANPEGLRGVGELKGEVAKMNAAAVAKAKEEELPTIRRIMGPDGHRI